MCFVAQQQNYWNFNAFDFKCRNLKIKKIYVPLLDFISLWNNDYNVVTIFQNASVFSFHCVSNCLLCISLAMEKNCRWCLPARYMHIRLFPWVRALKKREKKATWNIYSIFQLIYVHWGLFWNEEQWQCQPNEMLHTDTVFFATFGSPLLCWAKMRSENEVKMYISHLENLLATPSLSPLLSFSTYTHTFLSYLVPLPAV